MSCLSVYPPFQAITFALLHIETSFLACRYIFIISRSSLSIKVIGSMSRSYEKNDNFTYFNMLKVIYKVKVTNQGEKYSMYYISGWAAFDWKAFFFSKFFKIFSFVILWFLNSPLNNELEYKVPEDSIEFSRMSNKKNICFQLGLSQRMTVQVVESITMLSLHLWCDWGCLDAELEFVVRLRAPTSWVCGVIEMSIFWVWVTWWVRVCGMIESHMPSQSLLYDWEHQHAEFEFVVWLRASTFWIWVCGVIETHTMGLCLWCDWGCSCAESKFVVWLRASTCWVRVCGVIESINMLS